MARVQDTFGLIGQTLDGKFRIERAVAEGGFAIVYAAAHASLRRPIAVKVLKRPPTFGDREYEEFIEGFAGEAHTIARISHPNIVQVLDFGVSPMPSGERAPWMVMEWLEGRTLREQMLERRAKAMGGFGVGEAVMMVRPVLEALAYAHDEGVAHRDVKPANVMLLPTRRGTLVKLLDFGIAKVMDEDEANNPDEHTRTNQTFQAFSLNYATPEQLGQMRTGPWTDVHAAALVFTELLTGKPALGGRDRSEIMGRVLGSVRPSPAAYGVDVGPLEAVLARALALRPADRFANAGEFLVAIDSALSAYPTEVWPAGFGRSATGSFPSYSGAWSTSITTGAPVPALTGELPAPASIPAPVEFASGAPGPSTLTAVTGTPTGEQLAPTREARETSRAGLVLGALVMVLGFTAGGVVLRMRVTSETAAVEASAAAAAASAQALASAAAAITAARAARPTAAPNAQPTASVAPSAEPSAAAPDLVFAPEPSAETAALPTPRPSSPVRPSSVARPVPRPPVRPPSVRPPSVRPGRSDRPENMVID